MLKTALPRSGLDMVCVSRHAMCDMIASNDWLQQLVHVQGHDRCLAHYIGTILDVSLLALVDFATLQLCLGCAFGSRCSLLKVDMLMQAGATPLI